MYYNNPLIEKQGKITITQKGAILRESIAPFYIEVIGYYYRFTTIWHPPDLFD
ncbi:hypothetical protein KSZ_35390 [Dictyobacter formicarum]|uniref:Uncharacterized protein n=1 Tax=Dictyobacter formicarum TaxID=2778368 RepID=A0ABQ3VJI5_9CHLR|nr:hypothetical protein KSZ_35390 [Dictyobacter formicarum]